MPYNPIRILRRLTWHRLFKRLISFGLVLVLSGCIFAPYAPALPSGYFVAKNLDDQYEAAYKKYQGEFDLTTRPPGTPKELSELFMRQYVPGPLPRVFEHTILTDRHGKLLTELIDEGRRTWVPLSRISKHLIDAVIATEDSSFYSNDGIDPKRLARAVMQNAQNQGVVSGASTITMQLARNLFFKTERRYDQSIDRKLTEIFIAQDLTKMLSKDEILEMYLNLIYFGHRAYGAEEAAQVYFGKSAANLTTGEATLLAGLPQSPLAWDPILNYTDAKQRQRIVLDLMVRHGYLSSEASDEIFYQDMYLNFSQTPQELLAPHFVRFVQGEVAERLGIRLSRAGLRITTTLDLSMQELGQKSVANQVKAVGARFNLSNGALIAMKPGNAEILAMVGSADFNNPTISGQVNNALSLRQPGSSIKAVLYATAFNDNLISPSTVLWDMPVRYPLNKLNDYIPANYDLKFHGPVTARTALANSYNIPAVKLLDAVGPDYMAEMGRRMGLSNLTEEPGRYYLPLTLGANEVTLLDMTTVYHTLSNRGTYVPYRFALSITDGIGTPIDLGFDQSAVQVISPEAAYLVTSVLSDKQARTPAFGANSALNVSHPAAAKTGTSTSYRDNWAVGYSRYIVVGVWTGNSNGRPMYNASGITGAAPIWHNFMEGVFTNTVMLGTIGAPTDTLKSDPVQWEFEQPEGISQHQIDCPKQIYCPNKTEYYSSAWLQKMGRLGPAGDSIAMHDKVASVWVYTQGNQFIAGVCSTRYGEDRTLLTLPAGYGLLAPPPLPVNSIMNQFQIGPHLPAPSLRTTQFLPMPVKVNERIQRERQEALNWSNRNTTALNLGPCESVRDVTSNLYGRSFVDAVVAYPVPVPAAVLNTISNNLSTSADITATTSTTDALALAVTPTPITTPAPEATQPPETALPEITPTPEPALNAPPTPQPAAQPTAIAAAASGGQYALAGYSEDNACAGFYIMGVVLNESGAPVAGMRLSAVDQWGNYSESVTKNNSSDFGRFDFPVDHRIRDFYVTVLDGSGNSVSPTITVNHQGDAGAHCHYLVWKRN